jgi:uncharacterized protein YcsI (UPF0317 family)
MDGERRHCGGSLEPEESDMIELSHAHPKEVRELFRSGEWSGPTTGLCLGFLQANMAILPSELAEDFRQLCLANPRPMPLIDTTQPGDPVPRRVAPEADLRTDLPRYRVYRDGLFDTEVTDISDLWREDLVAFLLGCSFTAEAKLLEAGVRLRHMELGQNVPMFRTSLECQPAGVFSGPVVVSMRPVARDQLDLARRVTAEYPLAHGGPLHAGVPAAIGLEDLGSPDWGDPIEPLPDEVPVFWACGVTPQAVIMAVQPKFAITHAPGHMFITDVPDTEIRGREPELAGIASS